MKHLFIKLTTILVIISLVAVALPGCYGKFQLTRNLYKWNGQVGDKAVNTLVMWVLFILPVYEIAGAVDFAILNVMEYWTGENPVTMAQDEKDTQLISLNGKQYEITATTNQFQITELGNDNDISRSVQLIFDEANKSWSVKAENSEDIKIAQLNSEDENILHLFTPDGQVVSVDIYANKVVTE